MMHIKVKIKRTPDAELPVYMTEGAAGADIFSSEDTGLEPGETRLISTGIFMEIPDGYECQIRPRSGLSYKNQIIILNSPGTIDSDYRGEVKIIMHNLSEKTFAIRKGDRIAQMVFSEVSRAEFIDDELNGTDRNDGGFGHTGGHS